MTKYPYPCIPSLCLCGCGGIVWRRKVKYIHGHGRRGTHNTLEHKQKNSLSQRGVKRPWQVGENNPSKRPDVIAKLSGQNNHFYGKHHTEESLRKITEASRKASSSKSKKLIGHPISRPHRSDLWYESKTNGKICFRSSWELEFAKYSDSLNELWFYEFWTFDLGDKTYTPDFYLPRRETFVEIKGKWYPTEKVKFDQFKEEYPFENILLVDYKPPYNNIRF